MKNLGMKEKFLEQKIIINKSINVKCSIFNELSEILLLFIEKR